ncbi:MAG: RimK/LysX family protein [Phycisphaeraceae bacterium]|nr:RimK/LysX family protein [Phycisphaeraceae bacterium]
MKQPKPIIGWREWVLLPELCGEKIKAKIDTGARTSALHAFDLAYSEDRQTVRFNIHPLQRDTSQTIEAEGRVVDERPVRSSGGHVTVRPVILTELQWLDHRFKIELTLVNRDHMGFRMLLGRQAIRDHFCVDPGRSFLGGRKKVKKKKKKKKKKRTG